MLEVGGLVVYQCQLALTVDSPRLLCWQLVGEKYMHNDDICTLHEVCGLVLHQHQLRLRPTVDDLWLLCWELVGEKDMCNDDICTLQGGFNLV